MQLGIEPQHSPFMQPWFRATIERWFGTLNKGLLHRLPGTTFSNIFEKGDYDPTKHALISLKGLLESLHLFIVDMYHQSYHRGINDIPYRRWVAAAEDWSPNLPPNASDLEILIGFTESRCISNSGIELYTLFYNSSELGFIRRSLGKDEKVTVKIDPTDISSIYVWDKINCAFIKVPALNYEYTEGLSLWQHNVIRKFARRWIIGLIDDEALCRARVKVEEIVERERLLTKNINIKQKDARFLNNSQPNYWRETLAADTQLAEVPSLTPPISQINTLLPVNTPIINDNGHVSAGSGLSDVDLLSTEAGWSSDYDLPV